MSIAAAVCCVFLAGRAFAAEAKPSAPEEWGRSRGISMEFPAPAGFRFDPVSLEEYGTIVFVGEKRRPLQIDLTETFSGKEAAGVVLGTLKQSKKDAAAGGVTCGPLALKRRRYANGLDCRYARLECPGKARGEFIIHCGTPGGNGILIGSFNQLPFETIAELLERGRPVTVPVTSRPVGRPAAAPVAADKTASFPKRVHPLVRAFRVLARAIQMSLDFIRGLFKGLLSGFAGEAGKTPQDKLPVPSPAGSDPLGDLGALRAAASAYFGAHEGYYPRSLSELAPGYMPAFPELRLGRHPASSLVEEYGPEICAGLEVAGDRLRDTGRWGYVTDKEAACFGHIFIDCTHSGGVRSRPWYRY